MADTFWQNLFRCSGSGLFKAKEFLSKEGAFFLKEDEKTLFESLAVFVARQKWKQHGHMLLVFAEALRDLIAKRAKMREIALEVLLRLLQEMQKLVSDSKVVRAALQAEIGNCYLWRIRGERDENVEAAIFKYQHSLKVFDCKVHIAEWTKVKHSLGQAMLGRLRGDRRSNVMAAIHCFRDAINIYKDYRGKCPLIMAEMRESLARAYMLCGDSDRDLNIQEAISQLLQTLPTYSKEEHPHEWARVHDNLAVAYAQRLQGSKRKNLEAALRSLTYALEVFTPSEYPSLNGRVQLTIKHIQSQLSLMEKSDSKGNSEHNPMSELD